MQTKIGHEAIYIQIGRLLQNVPILNDSGVYPPDTLKWLAEAHALVSALGNRGETMKIRQSIDTAAGVTDRILREPASQIILTTLYIALASAELNSPAISHGSFIPAGNSFEAFSAMSKLLCAVKNDVMIVDPYMDEKALTIFAPLVPETCSIRLLADEQHKKPTLQPAARSWILQYDQDRPLEVRSAAKRSLHDRLIIIDEKDVWILTQSLNAFAVRAPASIVRVDPETAALKINAYSNIWNSAAKLE